jgi:hypothetical protein
MCGDGSVESEGGSGVVIHLGIWNFESIFVAVNELVILMVNVSVSINVKRPGTHKTIPEAVLPDPSENVFVNSHSQVSDIS